jgi:hypothetical protein
MNLEPDHLKGKPKEIGKTKKNGHPVYSIVTKGGYALVVEKTGKSFDVLGASPHIAISKHIAKKTVQKKDDEIEFNDLEKSEEVAESTYAHLVPKYEEVTEQFQVEQKNLKVE